MRRFFVSRQPYSITSYRFSYRAKPPRTHAESCVRKPGAAAVGRGGPAAQSSRCVAGRDRWSVHRGAGGRPGPSVRRGWQRSRSGSSGWPARRGSGAGVGWRGWPSPVRAGCARRHGGWPASGRRGPRAQRRYRPHHLWNQTSERPTAAQMALTGRPARHRVMAR